MGTINKIKRNKQKTKIECFWLVDSLFFCLILPWHWVNLRPGSTGSPSHINKHCTALHCIVLQCTTLHCTVLHCIALHCTALHCTANYRLDHNGGRRGRAILTRHCVVQRPVVYCTMQCSDGMCSVQCSAVGCIVSADSGWKMQLLPQVYQCNVPSYRHHKLHCTTLHYTSLHCTALHCTALHCTALHSTTLHCIALLCTQQH